MSLFMSPELEAGLKALKVEHGTPEAESIRRAVAAYLTAMGVLKATPKGGPTPRKRT
jgi:predicted DNA-binding protein